MFRCNNAGVSSVHRHIVRGEGREVSRIIYGITIQILKFSMLILFTISPLITYQETGVGQGSHPNEQMLLFKFCLTHRTKIKT